jgi:predicted Zn finger-like uncharacterized protein
VAPLSAIRYQAMLIICPNCTTTYDVGSQALGDSGRIVRCTRCLREWIATASTIPRPPGQMPPPAPSRAFAATAAVADRVGDAAIPGAAFDRERLPDPQLAPDAANSTAAGEDEAGSWGVPEIASPPLAPAAADDAAAAPVHEDIETLAARRFGTARRVARKRINRLALPLLPTVIAAQLLAIGAILAWRTEIVRALPHMASLFRMIALPVNLRGLDFSDMRASKDVHDGVTVLIIEGTIENATSSVVNVPRLRFSLRNAALAELLSWTAPPDKATLGRGEAVEFRSRLALPPADGNDVLVRFLNRRDFTDGAH